MFTLWSSHHCLYSTDEEEKAQKSMQWPGQPHATGSSRIWSLGFLLRVCVCVCLNHIRKSTGIYWGLMLWTLSGTPGVDSQNAETASEEQVCRVVRAQAFEWIDTVWSLESALFLNLHMLPPPDAVVAGKRVKCPGHYLDEEDLASFEYWTWNSLQ